MLFNSYPFLFVFFPAAVALYFCASRIGGRAGSAAIVLASVVFYASWDVRFLALLGGSILTNYAVGRALSSAMRRNRARPANGLAISGVALNLLVLGIFKYSRFAVENVNGVLHSGFALPSIILPLGISFFTFEQIGYLIDIRRGNKYPAGLLSYSVFVSFFPRLVAGPILRYNEILPQLAKTPRPAQLAENLTIGLTMFFAGLAKKTMLADGIAPLVAPLFSAAAAGKQPDLLMAWGGALAYTLQIYFDFSGYSDMAIGAARCFGIKFPQNFNSPYKAASIIEFWRRWHMTLSRFLRDYLYIGLGGNRRGPARRYANLMITMLLGGLWHGANWTFIVWGGLHGVYLAVNHLFRERRARNQTLDRIFKSRLGQCLCAVVTFASVVVAWVFFRAPDFGAASAILRGMAGLHGINLPSALAPALGHVQPVLNLLGVGYAETSGTEFVKTWLWIAALLGIALLTPNTQELMARYEPALGFAPDPGRRRTQWAPTLAWATATGALGFAAVISITRVSTFLYWQF